MASISLTVKGGAATVRDNGWLVTAMSLAAFQMTAGAVLPVAVIPASATRGFVVTRIVLRTLSAVSGFTLAPTVSFGWDASASNLVPVAATVPVAADSQAVTIPAAVGAIGQPGQTLAAKVANLPVALGTPSGVVYVDVAGYQIS